MTNSLGLCPLCGQECNETEELTQLDGGPHGICHVYCVARSSRSRAGRGTRRGPEVSLTVVRKGDEVQIAAYLAAEGFVHQVFSSEQV